MQRSSFPNFKSFGYAPSRGEGGVRSFALYAPQNLGIIKPNRTRRLSSIGYRQRVIERDRIYKFDHSAVEESPNPLSFLENSNVISSVCTCTNTHKGSIFTYATGYWSAYQYLPHQTRS